MGPDRTRPLTSLEDESSHTPNGAGSHVARQRFVDYGNVPWLAQAVPIAGESLPVSMAVVVLIRM